MQNISALAIMVFGKVDFPEYADETLLVGAIPTKVSSIIITCAFNFISLVARVAWARANVECHSLHDVYHAERAA